MEPDTALHTALLERVRTLHSATPDQPAAVLEQRTNRISSYEVNSVGPAGSTVLLMVCTQGVLADVQLLLDADADPALEGVVEIGRPPTVPAGCCVA